MRLPLFFLMLCATHSVYCQQIVPILSYEVSSLGTPVIEVQNNPSFYYVLYANNQARTLVQSEEERALLTEPVAALAEESYEVRS